MNWAQHTLIFGVRVYQRTLSPVLASLAGPLGHCRFEPTCSQYALEAVRLHGAVKGSWLAAWRLARCGPWGACGHDPVPPRKFKVEGLKFKVFQGAETHLRHFSLGEYSPSPLTPSLSPSDGAREKKLGRS